MAATCPRRSWPPSSSSRPRTTPSATIRRSGRSCASSWATLRRPPDAASTARTASPRPCASRPHGWPPARPARSDARPPPSRGLRLYLKREDLAHTGAHKINNALGQSLLTRRLGKTRVIAETGAGQHGVATATACALLDLPCVVYMGAEDIERQQPNVLRMRALGAEVRAVTSGHGHAQGRGQRGDARLGHERGDDPLRPGLGDGPAPVSRRSCATSSGASATRPPPSFTAVEGRLPDLALACVGGGSNAIGLLARFIGEPTVRLAVVEAAGDGMETGRHAAAILGGTPGILHGSRSLMLQDADGQVIEAHSASAGLDYPGIGPQLAALAEGGRIEVAVGHRSRGGRRDADDARGPRGSCRRSRRRTPSPPLPKLLAGGDGIGRRLAGRCSSCCSGSPAAATRTSPLWSDSPTSSPGPGAPMTGDEVRALCLGLPGTHREGDLGRRRAQPGHPTFRVRDKIYVIMAEDGSGGSIRTSKEEQAALIAAFPDAAYVAGYVGRFGWVDLVVRTDPGRGPARDHRSGMGPDGPQEVAAAWRASR